MAPTALALHAPGDMYSDGVSNIALVGLVMGLQQALTQLQYHTHVFQHRRLMRGKPLTSYHQFGRSPKGLLVLGIRYKTTHGYQDRLLHSVRYDLQETCGVTRRRLRVAKIH